MSRCEISPKVICEKVKFSNFEFFNNFVTMNGQTYKIFKNMLNDVQIKDKGEINTINITAIEHVLHLYGRINLPFAFCYMYVHS